MGDDRNLAIVMHIDFYAFDAVLQIFNVPLYLRVAGQLVPRQVGVVGRIAKVLRDGEILIDLRADGGVVYVMVAEVDEEVIET